MSDTTPLVSIVTPAWNAEKFLPETHASVAAQSWRNWEWLIVDDASTDETAAVAAGIAARDHRVRVIGLHKNQGQAGRVRNVGLAASRGEFIAFLDADDAWEPSKLERQVALLRENPAASVVCTYIRPFGDPEAVARWGGMMPRTGSIVVTPDQVAVQSMATSSILMRRSCYEKIGGMDEDARLVIGEDTEYGMRLVANFSVLRICEPLTLYRVRDTGGSLSSVDAPRRLERALALHEIIAAKGLLPPNLLRQHRALVYYNEAKNNLFHYGLPWRRLAWRAVMVGDAPAKAWVLALLCWLPAPLLRPLLVVMLAIQQKLARR